jgi:biotin carboxylase
MKTILIVSGGIEAADAAKRAREMGLHVVVSDIDHDAPGFAFAHDRLIADVYAPEETARVAQAYHRKVRPIDGVICVAADAPMSAALLASRLGLLGISLESARLASDKLAMKRCFAAAGVPVPWFAPVESAEHLKVLVEERGRDLVIKPVDSRGSRGVQWIARVADLASAYALARRHSPSTRVMAEAYLEGPQVSTESIVMGERCFTPGFSDRNYEFLERHAPFFVENGGDLPSRLPVAVQEKIKSVVADAAAAMGVTNGVVKGDIVVHRGAPYVIELAARLSGGFFCTREIPLNTGVDFVGCAIRVALGEPVEPAELEPRRQIPVTQRYAFARPGRVVRVTGADDARRLPGIADVVVTAKEGDIIPAAGDKRPSAAMVVATGPSGEAARASAEAALALIAVETR